MADAQLAMLFQQSLDYTKAKEGMSKFYGLKPTYISSQSFFLP